MNSKKRKQLEHKQKVKAKKNAYENISNRPINGLPVRPTPVLL